MKPAVLLVGNFLSSHARNPTFADEFACRLVAAGYALRSTSSVRSRPFRLVDMIMTAFIRRKEYQVAYVEVYSGAAFLWAEMVGGLLGSIRKPYILALHGGNLPAFSRRWPGRVKRLLKGARAITAPSRYLQEEMRLYREDVFLIPNALDLDNYPFRLRSTTSPRLVWLRAFHDIYNPQLAPLVMHRLRASFPEISLTMIGPDKGDGSLEETRKIIEELGLQKNIGLVPGIPKRRVPELLERADIFINTTNIDNTPVSVLEAMACGLCVVSTEVGGIPYLLDHALDALLVLPHAPDAMADAVKRILTEPGLAGRLSGNARCKTEQFDWSVILPQWEALFQEVLDA